MYLFMGGFKAVHWLSASKVVKVFACADIVEIKHIMLPPSPREFKDIYVVFELMETDLHQVMTLSKCPMMKP